MLFDSHMHLFDAENAKDVITKAEAKGVYYFVSNATNPDDNLRNIELARKYKQVMIGVGLYPLEIKTKDDLLKVNVMKDSFLSLPQNLRDRAVIGEIGLDFKETPQSEVELQYIAFKEQIEFAKEQNKFVEVHSRYAVSQTLKTLIECNAKKAIMHWYTESKKYVKEATDQGYYVTLGPQYLYNSNIKEIVKGIDPKNILFETDYPVSFSGVRQTPDLIYDIALKYSSDFDISLDEIYSLQQKNFNKMFLGIRDNC